MPQHTTPRQPLSCENCRKRKIKCHNSSSQVPCATCVRRGHSHSCFFKRAAPALADNSQQLSNSNEGELLCRIRNLEDLLRQQVPQSSQPLPQRLGSTPTGSEDRYSSSGYQIGGTPSPRPTTLQRGRIITSPAGYQHFAPAASRADANLAHELTESVPSPLPTTSFPFSDTPCTQGVLLDILPPSRQCDQLKFVFFEVFSPLFHILHDPTFDAFYVRFQQDPSSVPLSWLALLFVILAIAVTALDDNDPLLRDLGRELAASANMKKLSTRYRSAAMQCLATDQFLFQHNLQTLQTLVLLIYAMNHANISSWALLGTTFNIAVRIGCHIDPSRLELGVIEGEERRRCWAALMMLYTVQNTCMGNIAPQNITAEVELPADIDDDKLTASHFQEADAVGTVHTPSKMSYILHKFRLYNIAADICQCDLDEQLADPRNIIVLDQRLERENQEHTSRFSGQDLPLYHIAHHYILQSYTHHLYLVLHRTSLNSPSSDKFAVRSRQRCKDSAITILEAHGRLYETAEFRPYLWYSNGIGSFHAFLAVSILIVLANKSHPAEDDLPRICKLIELCFHRFENMSARSDVCAKAVVILRRILGNSTEAETLPSSVATNESSNLQVRSLYQLPISPNSDSEQNPMDTYNWASTPELEAILFNMAPQRWMTPSSFTWDPWNNAVVV